MKNKFYHISTYSVMRYWTILWKDILSSHALILIRWIPIAVFRRIETQT